MNELCRADIKLSALEHNLSVLNRALDPAQAICMVKANAYGHGARIVATHLEKLGVKWFGVATVDEAVELRNAGITSRILVMSGAGAHFFARELISHRLTPLISSLEEVEAMALALRKEPTDKPFRIHLDVDTGMSRGGLLASQGPEFLCQYAQLLQVEGVSTHFAKAEETDCAFSTLQWQRFAAFLKRMIQSDLTPLYVHVDKSASALWRLSQPFMQDLRALSASFSFLGRPGIALYGIDPSSEGRFVEKLQPVLSWRAPIVVRKTLPSGTPIGYDGTFTTNRDTELALVRVGYADGLKRALSNRGSMIVAGRRVPIVGRISMDLTAIDVTDVVSQKGSSFCELGQFASIICNEYESLQNAYDLAKACDTIPYEILTSISARVQRFPL